MNGTKRFKSAASPPRGVAAGEASDYGTLALIGACLVALASMFLPGCSNPSLAHAVDVSEARDALKIALDGWKKGENPRSFASSQNPMVIQDFEWASGAKLIDYQLIDDGKAFDANLRIQVKLTLSADQGAGVTSGKTTEKKVWYLVGTSPQVTVFRDMLRR
jgi:hypothetical protein